MPRTGRPPIFTERVYLNVALEAAELRGIHARAKVEGVTASAWVRRLVVRALGSTRRRGGARR